MLIVMWCFQVKIFGPVGQLRNTPYCIWKQKESKSTCSEPDYMWCILSWLNYRSPFDGRSQCSTNTVGKSPAQLLKMTKTLMHLASTCKHMYWSLYRNNAAPIPHMHCFQWLYNPVVPQNDLKNHKFEDNLMIWVVWDLEFLSVHKQTVYRQLTIRFVSDMYKIIFHAISISKRSDRDFEQAAKTIINTLRKMSKETSFIPVYSRLFNDFFKWLKGRIVHEKQKTSKQIKREVVASNHQDDGKLGNENNEDSLPQTKLGGGNEMLHVSAWEYAENEGETRYPMIAKGNGETHFEYKFNKPESIAKIEICNVTYETLEVEPVYLYKFDSQKQDVTRNGEMIMLECGQMKEVPYQITIDMEEGGTETIVTLRNLSGSIMMTLSFSPWLDEEKQKIKTMDSLFEKVASIDYAHLNFITHYETSGIRRLLDKNPDSPYNLSRMTIMHHFGSKRNKYEEAEFPVRKFIACGLLRIFALYFPRHGVDAVNPLGAQWKTWVHGNRDSVVWG